jgi:hypothetical protein
MPKLMIKPGGINILFDPVFGEIETHSSTCRHCQHITDFPSRRVMMEHVDVCRGCMELICLECVGKPCLPWEKQCELQETEFKLRSRVHLQAWRCY